MRSRASELTESLLQNRSDVEEIFPAGDCPDEFLDFYGGPAYFDDDCIYDSVDDSTACWLLSDWFDAGSCMGWNVNLELSKLLAKRGHLIRDRVEAMVRRVAAAEEDSYRFTLCLSFLPQMEGGESLAIQLLDQVSEDFRDGLFRACYRMNTPAIYEAVKKHVRRWIAADDGWSGGTGEAPQVLDMVKQWDKTFPNGDHADIRQFCENALKE